MDGQQLRNKIASEISNDLMIWLENCACLGRDAYGNYIQKCYASLLLKIKEGGNNG